MRQCSATTNAGTPCKAPAMKLSEVCSAHAGLIGGPVEGSGRKKKISDAQLLADEIRERADELVAKTFQLATEGQLGALRILFEYGFGRPRQSIELSGKDGGPITITELARRAAEDPTTEE